MGVYLSKPNCEKASVDEKCKSFTYGASCMQGWRMSQEDAHNCLPDYDGQGSGFFAVYDGHGGSEVAQYCSSKFPDFLKTVEKFKDGDYGPALQDAFIEFDAHLLKEDTLKELKVLAGVDDLDEEDEKLTPRKAKSEADMLRAEADMPIEDLMAQYEGGPAVPAEIKNLRKKKSLQSPAIRARRPDFPVEDDLQDEGLVTRSENKNNSASAVSSTTVSVIDEGLLSDHLANGHAENENNINREKEQKDIINKQVVQDSVSSSVDVKTDDNSVSSSTSPSVVKSEQDKNSSNNVQNSGVSSGEVSCNTKDEFSSEMESNSAQTNEDKSKQKEHLTKTEDKEQNLSESTGSGKGKGKGGKGKGKGKSLKKIEDEGAMEADPEFEGHYLYEDGSEEEEEDEEYDSEEEPESDSGDSEEYDEEEEEEEDEECTDFHNSNDPSSDEPGYCSGCTAVVAVIKNKQVIVANAGDSRCVLCRDGKAVDMSFDHKPEDEPERKRIEAAGGKVTLAGRVNGGLNLSRAIGDHLYKRNTEKAAKEQMISALPDIEKQTLQDGDEFLILACDGIWNFMNSQEVVDFVKKRLEDPEKRKTLSIICEELFDYCLAPNTEGDGTGCDNMTCIIVTFDELCTQDSNKRSCPELDSSRTGNEQPEKRPKLTGECVDT